MKKNKTNLIREFIIPIVIIIGIVLYVFFSFLHLTQLANLIALISILLGSYGMVLDIFKSILRKQFALDYIALVAIIVSVVTHEYLVGVILALMISGGETLEDYGQKLARTSLTKLVKRIPTDVTMWKNGSPVENEKLEKVKKGDEVFIRKGEVIGLDGELISEIAQTDESSLTGEPYFIDKESGDVIRSGTVNIGEPFAMKVTHPSNDSTYKKIIDMVEAAEKEKPPLVRLADRYSTWFTGTTFTIAAFAFYFSGFDLTRVLAVLAVATPCPLIIATPIALLGGMNASAKRKIIIKKLASLETLSRTNAIAFDKTGTITLGIPQLTKFEVVGKNIDRTTALSIAQSIERNSLHPLAKAIVNYASSEKAKSLHAENIEEILGKGIEGDVNGKRYLLSKPKGNRGMEITLMENKKILARFEFEDVIKSESKRTVEELKKLGLDLYIFTGDKKDAAQKIAQELGSGIIVEAEMSPVDKEREIADLKKQGKVTAMVGDGINDAPALASADVGMAFSSQEQTAASEAADIVFLGGDFSMVLESWKIANRTIKIATQSIQWGIGLSVLAMVFASVGLLPPIFGAGLQEVIDVAVILNALRASR